MVKISVIIPSLNEEKYIGKALSGFDDQTMRDFEIIVVDHNSKDKTVQIAKRYGRVINEPRPGIALARNTGAKHAKGDILIFMDADTKPCPHLIKSYYDAFQDDIVGATGPIFPLEKTSRLTSFSFKFVSVFLIRLSMLVRRPSMIGSNIAVRRSVFNKIRGFDKKLKTYEDWEFSSRLRKQGKIVYIKGAVAYTSVRRVKEWGIWGYAKYHIGNIFRYKIIKEAKDDYDPVR